MPDQKQSEPRPRAATTGSRRTETKRQRLAGRLLNLYDDERRTIARELHDTTAQNLAALSMNLTMLEAAMEDPVRSRLILSECNALADECLKEVRSLAYMLHPPLLDELGLVSALRAFMDLFQKRTGVTAELKAGSFSRPEPAIELAAFRVAQEALFNVHRHSGSGRAEVSVIRTGSDLEISVRDWGKGMDGMDPAQNSLGIAGMRERVRLLGGQLEIRNAGPGTLIRASFPMECDI